MGAAVALELAVAYPERLAGLALVGAAARLRVAPALLEGLVADSDAAIEQLVTMIYPEPASRLRAPAATEYRRWPGVLRGDLIACDGWDLRERVAGLSLPALVVCGDADGMTPPRLARELQALIGAELVLLPGVGHMPMVEAPGPTAAAIASLIARAT
jgi:pimeloyl-ACP methyl ester carboxylesterase